ncbi:MAG: hypothetical protein GY820_21175 [Gammaproteobacteria bacterium]|nr:hypothetical protein [Gammaproteobacteria bacterium]
MNVKELKVLKGYIDENRRLKQLNSSLLSFSSVGKLQSENTILRATIDDALQKLKLALNSDIMTPSQ